MSTDMDAFVEDAEFLADNNETLDGAAARLGVHSDTLERRLSRAGRPDVTRQLRANAAPRVFA